MGKMTKDFICNKDLEKDMKTNRKSNDNSIDGWTFIGDSKYRNIDLLFYLWNIYVYFYLQN